MRHGTWNWKKHKNRPKWLNGVIDDSVAYELSQIMPFIFLCCQLTKTPSDIIIKPENPKALIFKDKTTLVLCDGNYLIPVILNYKLSESLFQCRNKFRKRECCFWFVILNSYSFVFDTPTSQLKVLITDIEIKQEWHCLEYIIKDLPYAMSDKKIIPFCNENNVSNNEPDLSERESSADCCASSACSCLNSCNTSNSKTQPDADKIITLASLPGTFATSSYEPNLISASVVENKWIPDDDVDDKNISQINSVETNLFEDNNNNTSYAEFFSPLSTSSHKADSFVSMTAEDAELSDVLDLNKMSKNTLCLFNNANVTEPNSKLNQILLPGLAMEQSTQNSPFTREASCLDSICGFIVSGGTVHASPVKSSTVKFTGNTKTSKQSKCSQFRKGIYVRNKVDRCMHSDKLPMDMCSQQTRRRDYSIMSRDRSCDKNVYYSLDYLCFLHRATDDLKQIYSINPECTFSDSLIDMVFQL